jgi:hypothetical protein
MFACLCLDQRYDGLSERVVKAEFLIVYFYTGFSTIPVRANSVPGRNKENTDEEYATVAAQASRSAAQTRAAIPLGPRSAARTQGSWQGGRHAHAL